MHVKRYFGQVTTILPEPSPKGLNWKWMGIIAAAFMAIMYIGGKKIK